MDDYQPETTASLMYLRKDWLRVIPLQAPGGGIDIALVIDGTYYGDRDPRQLVEDWEKRISAAMKADEETGVYTGAPPGRLASPKPRALPPTPSGEDW